MSYQLGHVAVRVKDMDRAVAYYMSLGFNCEWESDNRADPHFAMHIENEEQMNDIRKKLIDMGHHCDEPYKHRDGTVSFYTRDPEGNQLEFLYI